MNKNGFTFIEIIVCIALLSVIGVGATATVVSLNNKKENDVLILNEEDFENALNIYLSTHNEVLSNLYNSVEGAVVSLELLKNEGLISSDLNIDYDDNYFILSDAVLLNNGDNVESECNGNVSIQTIKSWDLKNVDSSKVLYICPKSTSSGTSNGSTIINNVTNNYTNVVFNNYMAKGYNALNWVTFNVTANNNEWVYFPNDEEQNLWRIVNINDNNEIKLIYNKNISVNNNYNPNYDFNNCNEEKTSCELNEASPHMVCGNYYKWGIMADNNLSINGIFGSFAETDIYSPKYYIYNAINNKNWLKKEDYKYSIDYPEISGINVISSFDLRYVIHQWDSNYNDFIGNLSLSEIRDSYNSFDTSYIPSTMFAHTSNSNDKYKKIAYIKTDVDGSYEGIDYTSQSYYCGDGGGSWWNYYYAPVITLNSNIKIKEFNNCSDGSVRGSKNCPYELIES